MKLSISSLVTLDAGLHAARIAPPKVQETYRARIVDLDDDDAPTKLQSRPIRARTREIQARF
jgi:hypothetical protein